MKCTPEIEDRLRGIIGKTALCGWFIGVFVAMAYIVSGPTISFALGALITVAFCLVAGGIVLFIAWCLGEINICKRTNDDEEDDSEYDDML